MSVIARKVCESEEQPTQKMEAILHAYLVQSVLA